MNHTKLAVSRFENRNGVTSWRVAGWLHGVRIRKNLKTREEAAAEKAALELKALQATAGLRSETTFLTPDQLREAEAAFRRLGGRPRSLLVYLDYGLTNFREPEEQKPLADAVAEYFATKKLAEERTLLSMRQLRSIQNELAALKRHFPQGSVSQFTPALLVPYLERGKPSLKTYNNRRGLLSTFFKFALQKDWIITNPVEKTPHHRINHRRGSATTITAEQAANLMAYVESYEGGEMVPYFAICLFAGIRPCVRFGEITKLQPESVKLETGTIHIEPGVSKVRMKRLVTIQPNLAAWLRAYPLKKFPLIPPNAMNMHKKICAKFELTHDVLRHTFISMFVAKFRSMGEAALQAGNSESIIRKHYLDLKSAAEAEQFFGILPKRANESAPPFAVLHAAA
jgi:integrase